MLFIDGDDRAFSLASSPTEDFLMISIKMTGSGFKEKLDALEGQEVTITGPFGRFVFEEGKKQNHSHVMIAGGIGVTPFRSMIKYATDKSLDDRIILLYSNKTEGDISFLEELKHMQNQNKNLSIVHTLTQTESSDYRTGRIDENLIREEVDDIKNSIFYVCGPPVMVDTMVQMLKEMGIKEIRFERFVGY